LSLNERAWRKDKGFWKGGAGDYYLGEFGGNKTKDTKKKTKWGKKKSVEGGGTDDMKEKGRTCRHSGKEKIRIRHRRRKDATEKEKSGHVRAEGKGWGASKP